MNHLVTEARALCNVATPGPWEIRVRGNTVQSHQVVEHGEYSRTDVNIASGISPKTGNAAFIARSRTLITEMAAEIERLQAELDALKADIEAGRLVRLHNCDECRFKVESESWKYYTYPCNACRKRVKDQFDRAEALAAPKEDV